MSPQTPGVRLIGCLLTLILVAESIPAAAIQAFNPTTTRVVPQVHMANAAFAQQAMLLDVLFGRKSLLPKTVQEIKSIGQFAPRTNPGTFPILMWLYNLLGRVHPFVGYILAPAFVEWWVVERVTNWTGRNPSWFYANFWFVVWWYYLHFLPPWRFFQARVKGEPDLAWSYMKAPLHSLVRFMPLFWTGLATMTLPVLIVLADPNTDAIVISSGVFIISHMIVLYKHYQPYVWQYSLRHWILVQQSLDGHIPLDKLPTEVHRDMATTIREMIRMYEMGQLASFPFDALKQKLGHAVIPWFLLPLTVREGFQSILANAHHSTLYPHAVFYAIGTQFDVPKKTRGKWGWSEVAVYLELLEGPDTGKTQQQFDYIPTELRPGAIRLLELIRISNPSSLLGRHQLASWPAFKVFAKPITNARGRWGKPSWSHLPQKNQIRILDLLRSEIEINRWYAGYFISLFDDLPNLFKIHPQAPNNNPPFKGSPPSQGGSNDQLFRTAA